MFKSIGIGVYGIVAMVIFVATVGAWAVFASVPYFPKALQNEVVDCPPSDVGYVGPTIVLDDYEAEWFAAAMRGLREKPLFERPDTSSQIVRFTWLRSFDAPVMVRLVETPAGQVRIVARRMDGMDGCVAGTQPCEVDRPLTAREHAQLTPLLNAVRSGPGHECRGGLDGARWIMEFSGHGPYKFAQSFSPDAGPIHDLGVAMLGLTGWQFRNIY